MNVLLNSEYSLFSASLSMLSPHFTLLPSSPSALINHCQIQPSIRTLSHNPMATAPLVFLPPNPRTLHPPTPNRSTVSASRAKRLEAAGLRCGCGYGTGGGSSRAFMCSTTPFIGRVGLQRRLGNLSLPSFGVNADQICENSEDDSSQLLSAMLPVVVAATAIAALAQPSTFTWVSKEMYAPALGGIMLSIGITLSLDDFALAFKRPLPLSIGFLAQYMLKPVLGVLIAQAFGMSPMFYAGFILTACVAGAQLSSYATFLSKGDVALSVLLTSSSTIASVIVTPLLTGLLIGSVVPVDAVAMSKSILQVVLVPITLGLVLNTYAKPVVNFLQPLMPFVAMVCTSLCIGSPLAINRAKIMSFEGLRLIAPVLTFHALAFTIGYWISKLPFLRQEEEVSRTISICTGMQSSTLAGLLATQFLQSSQAVPPACSVVAMAIMGLCLASFWGIGLRIRDLPLMIFHPGSTVEACFGTSQELQFCPKRR